MDSAGVRRILRRRGRLAGLVPGPRWRQPVIAVLATTAAAVLATAGLAVGGTSARTISSRPFEHARHEVVSCRECHGAGERHGVTLIQSARDCAACHHDPDRRLNCAVCHEQGGPQVAATVRVSLLLSVWEAARWRDLPFAHRDHAAAGCTDCHGAPVTLGMIRECGACHESHHGARADCASCHPTPDRTVHPPEAHLSCAGAGCHTSGLPPQLSRSFCITCHPARLTHEPGHDCAGCHGIPGVRP